MTTTVLPKALFDASLSLPFNTEVGMTLEEATKIFRFFQSSPLFKWADAKNDCEDRAHAICLLLESWNLPAYKGWVFGGQFLKRTTGCLIQNWNYHVAAALPVYEAGGITIYIIDPATTTDPVSIYEWADRITAEECSYYFIRDTNDYIFNSPVITNDNWHCSNRQNYKWTIQGLAGINGVSPAGKAQLVFNKKRIRNTEKRFKALLHNKPL